jgi:hypothetical protein
MSAKAEYAVRTMVGLATAPPGVLVKTEDLAKAQGIPPQFLVDILSDRRTDRLVAATAAAGAGMNWPGPPPTSLSPTCCAASTARWPASATSARRSAVLRSDRRADGRVAGAGGQHAFCTGRDQPRRRPPPGHCPSTIAAWPTTTSKDLFVDSVTRTTREQPVEPRTSSRGRRRHTRRSDVSPSPTLARDDRRMIHETASWLRS